MTKAAAAAGVKITNPLIGSLCDAANPVFHRKMPHSYASHADVHFVVGDVAQEI